MSSKKVDLLDVFHIKRAEKYDAIHLDEILEELRQTRKLCIKLDDIIENSPDGICITDGDATAIRINKAFSRISGLDITEMIGRNHRDLEKEKMIVKSSDLMVVEQRKPVTIIQEYIPSNKKALVTSNPVFDEDGNISTIVSNIRDLTELLELRTQLEQQAKKVREYERQLEAIKKQIVNADDLIIEDKKSLLLISMASRVTQVDSTLLLTGETGVGKEVYAKYIHRQSPRKNKPFIVVNCGAIPANLVESELFGYKGGSFTGALREGKIGLLEAANTGTLLLDEVGELPQDTQVKLLRVLQEKKIQRIGGVKQRPVDVRIISTTNRDLLQMVKENKFREDLYYRLCIVPIHIPPLRERKDDIIPFINHFLDLNNKKYNTNKSMSCMGYQVLFNYSWPGNVRELKSVIERIVVMTDHDVIMTEDIPIHKEVVLDTDCITEKLQLADVIEKIEYNYIVDACKKFNSARKAAKYLGMPITTFVRKRKKYAVKYSTENVKDSSQSS